MIGENAKATQQRGTNIQANSIEIKWLEGDISMTGAKLQANDIVLDAAKNLNLLAAQNTAQLQSQHSASSAGVGVTFGLGEQNGISFQIGANNAKGRGNGSETTFDNTQVTATNNLTLKSGNDTNLIGAQAAGKTVTADVGGQLNIQSLQDSSNYESKQTTGGFGLSLCIPPFCYGTPVTGNVSASKQQIDHNYQSTAGQSGIAAGTGGFDIKVAGATDLKGAAITSEADKSKNSLSTSALTYSDLNNQQNTSASSSSISVGYGGGSMLSTLASNVTSNLLSNGLSSSGLPKSGSESSVTQSVISPAQVTITGGDKQSEDNVATLTSRDASTANGSLKNTMTLQQAQELQAQQREAQENAIAAQYIGSVLNNVIGDMGVKYGWADGSNEKTALHGLSGLIQAKVAGTSALSGAAVGALNEKLLPELEKYLVDQGYPKGSAEFNALITAGSTLAGAALGAIAGGATGAGAGAGIAYSGTVNNYLKHNPVDARQSQLRGFAEQLKRCKETSGCSVEGVYSYWSGVSASQQSDAKNAVAEWAASGDAANLGKFIAGAAGALGANPADFCSSGDSKCYQFIQSQNTQAYSAYRDATIFLASMEHVSGIPRTNGNMARSTPEGYQPFEVTGMPPKTRAIVDISTGEVKALTDAGKIIDLPASPLPTWTTAADNSAIKVVWGKGIQAQGMPWEDYLAAQMPSGSRLPPNFETFDFFNRATGVATSAKTLDTMTAARLTDPTQLYTSLKGNIDVVFQFEKAQLGNTVVDAASISARQLQVAVPAGTTPAQWQQIEKAIQYGKNMGIKVVITAVN